MTNSVRPAPERIDHAAVEKATHDLLVALGFDPSAEAIRGTPARVARAWKELLAGYTQTAPEVLKTTFDSGKYDQLVALRGIAFYSMCEHHLLPFYGTADVAYIPGTNGTVVGLSKLARLVDMHARRLQLQERMTKAVATDLSDELGAAGVAVIIRATHLCMCARGVAKDGAQMVTSDVRGLFRTDASALAEMLTLLKM